MRIEGEIVLSNVDDGKPASNVLIEYSVSGGEPWSSTYADGYKWFRISTDGGKTWSAAMKFIGDNGTSVTIKGTALGHYKESENIPSGLATGIYLQDPMKAYRINGKLLTDVSVTAGDGYLLNGFLYVATPTAWQNVGQIKGDKGEPGVNPVCYRLVQDGNGICTAGIVQGNDASGKPTVSVEMTIDLSFSIYKFVGDSAERLGSSSGFTAESVFVPAGSVTAGGITLQTDNTGEGFDVGCDGTVDDKDIAGILVSMSAVKVTLKQGDKVWDTVTVPVVTDQGQAYSRTKAMMESIYTNKENLSVFKQQADSISAMVYAHGTNMLYDAGFTDSTPNLDGTMRMRRFQTSAGNTVTVNGDGTLTISASGNTENKYTGIFWYVPVNALGKYTASVYDVQGGGFDGDKKAYMSIYACDANKKEKTALGGMMIGSDTDGKRIVLTSADVPEGTPYLEFGIYVIRNGTLKIKCPQLERGEEATDWTLRGVEDGLMKAGVDVGAGKVKLYADRTTLYNSKGKEIAVFDSDGNLLAGSLTCTKNGLTANVKPGEASFLKSGSALGIRIGIIDGKPALYATNEKGAVTWKLSIDYGTTTSDTAALTEVTGEGYAAYTTNGSISAPARTGVKVSAYGTLRIKNTSTVMHTYDANNISLKVDNLWSTETKNENCDVNLGNTGSVGVNGIGSMDFDIMATTSSTDTTNFPFSPWQATVHVLYLGNEIGSGKVTMSPDFS